VTQGRPRQLVETAFALLPHAVALVDGNGKLLYSSPVFDEIFPRFVPGADPGGILGKILATREPKEPLRFDLERKTFRAVGRTSRDTGEELTLWVIEDVTFEAAAERSRDEYLSTVVHDLRGPLAGIRGTLDFILEDTDAQLPDVDRELLSEAREEGNRMMNLVGEILDFAKIRAGRFKPGVEPVNVQILARRAVLSVRSLATRERITVDAEVPRSVLPVAASSDKLLQVVNNLLVNAFKFTPAGGVVLLSAESRIGPMGDRRVLIQVTDSGPGIPFEKQDELFSRFSEVGTASDKSIAGTGLGLFITKAIVEAFSGTITFATIPGVGTSFLVDLPAWIAPERRTGEVPVSP
jgi:signal transduction histidine kinase